jgi:hemoglobin
MKDIETRVDVEFLVNAFYQKVVEDDVIGYIFTDVAQIDWKKHMPIMYDFWETILLGVMKYKGNTMLKHLSLSKKEKLTPIHFKRWLHLWEQTISENFSGIKAKEAFERAKMMALLMEYKVKASENDHFIQ